MAEEDSHDVVGAIARISETGPFKLLLNRSFAALGDLLGELSEEYVDKVRQRRRENVAKHEEAVEKELSNRAYPSSKLKDSTFDYSPRTLLLLTQWATSGAADVDDSDEVLASFWRQALLAIRVGNPYAEECIEAVEKLTSVDAMRLIQISRMTPFRYSFVETNRVSKYISLGLVHPWHSVPKFLFLNSLVWIFLLIPMIFIGEYLDLFPRLNDPQDRIYFALFGFSLVISTASLLAIQVIRPRLTALGRYIVNGSIPFRQQ